MSGFYDCSHLSEVAVSKNNENYSPDQSSVGAFSRYLSGANVRMRVVIYPSAYVADHVCKQGHAMYIVSGSINIKLNGELTEWEAGDALIIPDEMPHVVSNYSELDAKVIVVDYLSGN